MASWLVSLLQGLSQFEVKFDTDMATMKFRCTCIFFLERQGKDLEELCALRHVLVWWVGVFCPLNW